MIPATGGGMNVTDRRRTPRVQLPRYESCDLHLLARVQLLDISASGALVGGDVTLPVGAQGQLRFALGGNTYAPAVQVRRRALHPRQPAFGVVFRAMDETSRRRLEEFLRKATS